ncbi:MAG TPA: hypothetical protein DEP84_01240, partial [Chloroflexi bacterium]|nr:hypothetical protein [Chloroflexota bacterium]
MQPGMSGLTFGADHPLDGDILLAAINGFTHLDIVAPKLECYLAQGEFDIRDLKRLFLRTRPGALDGLSAVEFGAAGRDILLARAEVLFKQARRVGAATLIVRPVPTEATAEEIVETLAALGAAAQRWSVRLAVAPAPSAGASRGEEPLTDPLASYAGLSALMAQVDQPSLGLLIDTVAVAREAALDWLSSVPPEWIVHVHLADAAADGTGPRLLPGAGELPLAGMLATL